MVQEICNLETSETPVQYVAARQDEARWWCGTLLRHVPRPSLSVIIPLYNVVNYF